MLRYLNTLDSYGEPVTVNFKGEATHKTLVGACVTFVINTLLLAVALISVKKLYYYDDANIIQVSALFEITNQCLSLSTPFITRELRSRTKILVKQALSL